jgi:hypothetical protein
MPCYVDPADQIYLALRYEDGHYFQTFYTEAERGAAVMMQGELERGSQTKKWIPVEIVPVRIVPVHAFALLAGKA